MYLEKIAESGIKPLIKTNKKSDKISNSVSDDQLKCNCYKIKTKFYQTFFQYNNFYLLLKIDCVLI